MQTAIVPWDESSTSRNSRESDEDDKQSMASDDEEADGDVRNRPSSSPPPRVSLDFMPSMVIYNLPGE